MCANYNIFQHASFRFKVHSLLSDRFFIQSVFAEESNQFKTSVLTAGTLLCFFKYLNCVDKKEHLRSKKLANQNKLFTISGNKFLKLIYKLYY